MSGGQRTIIVIERGRGCRCRDMTWGLLGPVAVGQWDDNGDCWIDCPHGSVVRALAAADIQADLAAEVERQTGGAE